MKDIENELKEKYDEVEVPSYMFDTSRVFKRVEEEKKQRNIKIITVAASVVAIVILTITIVFTVSKNSNSSEEYVEEIGNNINYSIVGKIDIKCKETSISVTDNINIQTIKINNIEEYVMIDNIPYTKVKATILKKYIGNVDNQILLYIPGGIFKVKDLKENIKEEIASINEYNEEDYIEVSFYNFIKIPIAEEEKIYISTIYKSEDGKYFVDMNRPYGFKEYDPETNIVKDDMGDVELDIDQYLDSIKVK